MELMGTRALDRKAFGKAVAEHGAFAADFARCRIELTAARLTVLDAAHALDRHGNKKVYSSSLAGTNVELVWHLVTAGSAASTQS